MRPPLRTFLSRERWFPPGDGSSSVRVRSVKDETTSDVSGLDPSEVTVPSSKTDFRRSMTWAEWSNEDTLVAMVSPVIKSGADASASLLVRAFEAGFGICDESRFFSINLIPSMPLAISSIFFSLYSWEIGCQQLLVQDYVQLCHCQHL